MLIAATLSPTLQKTQWEHKEKYMAESKIQQTLAKNNICRFYIISFYKPYLILLPSVPKTSPVPAPFKPPIKASFQFIGRFAA